MRLPKTFDAIDLYWGIYCFASSEALKSQGLSRRAQRNAKEATKWFIGEMYKAVGARKKQLKK